MSVVVLPVARLEEAVALLDGGAVLGVPTDTVYGLAARLDLDGSIEAIFEAKRRPAHLPIAVLCASPPAARALASAWGDAARRLAERFWPGALTLVAPCDPVLAARVGSSGGVGLRVPDDEVCRRLLERTGPLAVTSANLHDQRPCTSALEVRDAFDETTVAAVLDAGPRDGAVSTVVDVTAAPRVLREGALRSDEVLSVAMRA